MKKTIFTLVLILLTNVVLFAATPYDFDGDGRSDFGVRYLQQDTPGNYLYYWQIAKSGNNSTLLQQWGHYDFGGNGEMDHMRPADFDGDGKTDFAVQRVIPGQTTTTFYILNSSNNTIRTENFGRQYDDSTVIGDYDGDGKADLCVYGTVTKGYGFIYKGSLNNPNGIVTTVYADKRIGTPYRGDFDGDGKLDFCVRYTFSISPPIFTLKRSSDGAFENINWGNSTDELASGDYDGDGRTDFCVRRSDGTNYQWFILERDGGGTGANPIVFGLSNSPIRVDMPFGGADFDGDRKTDIGIFVYSGENQGTYYIRKTANGGLITFQFPVNTYVPIYGLDIRNSIL